MKIVITFGGTCLSDHLFLQVKHVFHCARVSCLYYQYRYLFMYNTRTPLTYHFTYNEHADQTNVFTPQDFSYSIRQSVTGFVYKVDKDWAWITITRDVRAQLYILDTACDPSELQEFKSRFHVGKRVSGYILNTNKEKKLLRMLLHPLAGRASVTKDGETVAPHISDGAVVGGRIYRLLPGVGGLIVQLDPHLAGKVHYTELVDSWISNPLSGYHEGQFVKCKVLDVSRSGTGTVHVDLSLRSSLVEMDG